MALIVESINFFPLENGTQHHTDRFEIVRTEPEVPVFRRGQEFKVAIKFANRDYIKSKDMIRVLFNNGEINVLKDFYFFNFFFLLIIINLILNNKFLIYKT